MTARLNLAPEVYQNNQRNKRRKQIATTVGVLVSAVALGLVAVGAFLLAGQKVYLATLQSQIESKQQKLKDMPDLQAAATIHEHLTSLDTLSDQKVRMSNFFKILEEYSPQGVIATNLSVNGTSIELSGVAKNYNLVNKFVKSIETRREGGNISADGDPLFTDTKLSSATDNGTNGVDFKISTTVSSEVTSGNN